jgi:hypothetical protein
MDERLFLIAAALIALIGVLVILGRAIGWL